MDAVIGLSAGPASGFSDLAAALRLSPAGVLDVRDGDVYRADFSHPYDLTTFYARMIADLTSHTYSVFEATGGALELARGYRFRTEQSAVAHLDLRVHIRSFDSRRFHHIFFTISTGLRTLTRPVTGRPRHRPRSDLDVLLQIEAHAGRHHLALTAR